MKVAVALLVVLVAFAVFHLGQMHSGEDKERYRWGLELDSGAEVWQSAVAIDSGPRVYISTKVYWLNSDSFRSSQLIQDFSTDTAVTVVKIQGVCYLLLQGDDNTTIANFYNETYTDIVDTMRELHGREDIEPSFQEVFMDATQEGALLNSTERRDLYDTNRNIFKICRPYITPIYRAYIGDEDSTKPGSCERRIKTILFRNETLTLTVPVRYGTDCGHHDHPYRRHYW